MGDSSPPPPPPQVQPPAPPSPGELADAAAQAQLKYEPQMFQLQQQQLPQYAQNLTDVQKTQQPQLTQLKLDLQKQYGPQLIQQALDNLKLADPTGFQIRDTLGSQILGNLKAGGNLSPEEQANLQNDIRTGQVARGVGTGFSDVLDEASFMANQRFAREQAREGAAASFLGLPSAQSGAAQSNMLGAPANPYNVQPMASQMFSAFTPSTNALMGLGMEGAQLGTEQANFASNYNMRGYEYVDQNTSNPWLSALAGLGSAAATAYGGSQGAKLGSQWMGAAGGTGGYDQYGGTTSWMGNDYGAGSPNMGLGATF